MNAYQVIAGDLAALKDLQDLPEKVGLAARRAVLKGTQFGRAEGARKIRKEVNLPARYLSGENGRLKIKKLPSGNDLEGIVAGRERPTSLARFSSGGTPGKAGVTVQVAPGKTIRLKRAFLMKLRAGSDADTRSNLGLAIRLKRGERVRNKRQMVKVRGNLYLLYGPSVAQVFRTVSEDIGPSVTRVVESEFDRQLDLK